MTMCKLVLGATAILAVVALQGASAQAMTMADCSAKYKEAKANSTLNGMTWNDFRKAQCGSEAGAGPAVAQASAPAPAPAAAPAPAGTAVFPAAVDTKFANESAGRARRHTCLDQYRANKANNANGGLKWLAKNGYYSQCNKKLKGA